MSEMKFNTGLAQMRIEKIQNLLRGTDCTVQEIADAIFLSKRWTYAYVNHLHENKKIHIAEYRKNVRSNKSWCFVPVYCWGEAKDAIKPKVLSHAEKSRRYRNDQENSAERKLVDANKKRAKRTKPTRDWTAAWIPTKEAA